ncbi:DUF3572 domain-containing protein [Pseudovibrio exalbescens]|uniref:DUF3572 domain-containing protein n=1 Tax=Pseudovibrio exalbescens TaxID=197461 RepID=A0A1U7JDQ5_9HYPH|nr:DUF3572 domain-containing protein [Pseudovibrio exalbescens]OKL42835.1 hypothetical protein A3843_16840 [Pseudovibrio exalbescens]
MMGQKSGGMSPEAAEELATSALAYLAQNPEDLGRFLSLAGIGPSEIRSAAEEPGFLAGVLEFYMQHEHLLLAFTETQGIRPTMIAAAHLKLSGGTDYFATP